MNCQFDASNVCIRCGRPTHFERTFRACVLPGDETPRLPWGTPPQQPAANQRDCGCRGKTIATQVIYVDPA